MPADDVTDRELAIELATTKGRLERLSGGLGSLFNAALHPRGYHGRFSYTGGRDRRKQAAHARKLARHQAHLARLAGNKGKGKDKGKNRNNRRRGRRLNLPNGGGGGGGLGGLGGLGGMFHTKPPPKGKKPPKGRKPRKPPAPKKPKAPPKGKKAAQARHALAKAQKAHDAAKAKAAKAKTAADKAAAAAALRAAKAALAAAKAALKQAKASTGTVHGVNIGKGATAGPGGLTRPRDQGNKGVGAAFFHAVGLAADSPAEPVGTHALWNKPGFALPPYMQHLANDLIEGGKSESEAIEMAIGIMYKWKDGIPTGGMKTVHPGTQSAAAKAIAQWEKLKAKAKSVKSVPGLSMGAQAGIELARQDGSTPVSSSGDGPRVTKNGLGKSPGKVKPKGKAAGKNWDTPEQRKRWADSGIALPDGSFPIPNEAFLRKAAHSIGRAAPEKRAKARAHIAKRAKALGVAVPNAAGK